jgi:putative transcriptional regulator
VESLAGKLLLAGGSLFDPNFRRTVVLIADHNEEGAAGVVLNHRSDVTVAEAAPSLASMVAPDDALYLGGPVQPQAAVVLAEFVRPELADKLILGSIGLVTGEEADEAREGISRARVYAGYSG